MSLTIEARKKRFIEETILFQHKALKYVQRDAGYIITSFASSKYKKITYLLTLPGILLPQ
jgi:hypothetical protein